MTVILDGSGLTIEKLVNIARNNEKVELHKNELKKIKEC
jgi:histidine ammonia-lyase